MLEERYFPCYTHDVSNARNRQAVLEILPCMAYAYYMVNIAQAELQKLVRENRSCIGKSKKRMIREYCPQPHGSSM